ncbi:MAG: helix-turn-helix transcriptional regulator [Atopobiaceae bacterium]|nr:helix-turn-helix transcriptional regulator [Atopobiaceae bacterium]
MINVLSKGESMPISAITPHTGVSERTVRRYLAALGEEGLVVMEGKGRWTTYRIV